MSICSLEGPNDETKYNFTKVHPGEPTTLLAYFQSMGRGLLKGAQLKLRKKWLGEADVTSDEGAVTLFTLPSYEGMLTVNKPKGNGFMQAGAFEQEKMAVSFLEGPQFITDSMQQPH